MKKSLLWLAIASLLFCLDSSVSLALEKRTGHGPIDKVNAGERTITAKGQDELVWADCNLDMIEEVRRTWQFYRDRRPETYDKLTNL